MYLWSRGLGTTQVKMNFEKYQVKNDVNNNPIIYGKMEDPVDWEFTIKLSQEDIIGFIKLFFTWVMIKYILLNSWRIIPYMFSKNKTKKDKELIEKVNKAYDQMINRKRKL